MQLLKELMDTGMPLLISLVEDEMLDKLREFALFDSSNPDVEERGRYLLKQFDPDAEEEYSLKFYKLTLECIVKWADQYPIADSSPRGISKYAETVGDISRARVRLPSASALSLYFNPSQGEPIPKPKSSKSIVVSRKASNTINDVSLNAGGNFLLPPMSSRQSLEDLAQSEVRETRIQIAEGIQKMRDHSSEFMSKLRMYDQPTVDFIGTLFAECIKIYGQFKPLFEPIIKSNDSKYKSERRAINHERNFVNQSHAEFQHLKKGMMDIRVFLANIEQHYSKYLLNRNAEQGTPDRLSERSKSPINNTSFKFPANDSNLGISQSQLMQSQLSNKLFDRAIPEVNDSRQEITSRGSNKRMSLPPQALNNSVHSRTHTQSLAKSVIDFFNEPFPGKITTGGLKDDSRVSASKNDFFQNDFNFSKNKQADVFITKPKAQPDFFAAPRSPAQAQTPVMDKDSFAGFSFPAQEPQSQRSSQNMFDPTNQVKNNLRELAQTETQQARMPKTHIEVSVPDTLPVIEQHPAFTLQQPSNDIRGNSRASIDRSGQQEVKQPVVYGSRMNMSNQSAHQYPVSTAIEQPTIGGIQSRQPTTPRGQSNVMINSKRAVIDVSKPDTQHANKPAENPLWFSGVNDSPQERQNQPQSAGGRQDSPHQSESNHGGHQWGLDQKQAHNYRQWMEEQALVHQAQQTEIDDLRTKVKVLQKSVYDKDEVDRRQRRTAEEERLKWEDSMRKLERENRELRARDKAKLDLEEDQRAEIEREKKEVESLLQELQVKNNEILSYQRQLSSIEIEAKDKIIQHLGLIEKLKEQYHKAVKERDGLTEENARNKVQAKLYVIEEESNKSLRVQIESQTQELNRMKSDLYLATSKCQDQEKQILEQVEIIKNCEIQVERSKSNFNLTLRQLNQSQEKERVDLIESHQREINRLMTRNRELEIQAIHKVTSSLARQSDILSPSTDLAITGILNDLETNKEHITNVDRSYLISLEHQMRHLKEESIKNVVDIGFLKDELKKKETVIEESQAYSDRLNREITELKEQNYQLVRDFYAKEKALNDMSQRHSGMMRKHTDMLKSLETAQKTEAQLRRELNEYHSRLMRLDAKYTSEIEESRNQADHSSELKKSQDQISHLESIVRQSIDEAVDLKRQLVESQANEEVLRLRILEERRRYSLLENDKDSLGDHIYQLKQKINNLEKQVIAHEFGEAALERMAKEQRMLRAQIDIEQQKTADLKNMLEKLSVVEDLKKKLSEIESENWENELNGFVEHLRGRLGEKTIPSSEERQIKNQDRLTAKATAEKTKLPFISWEEFNKNYNEFLQRGILYPTDAPSTDLIAPRKSQDLITLAPLETYRKEGLDPIEENFAENKFEEKEESKIIESHIGEKMKEDREIDPVEAGGVSVKAPEEENKSVVEQAFSETDRLEIDNFFQTYNREDSVQHILQTPALASPQQENQPPFLRNLQPAELTSTLDSTTYTRPQPSKDSAMSTSHKMTASSPPRDQSAPGHRQLTSSSKLQVKSANNQVDDQLAWTEDDMKMFDDMKDLQISSKEGDINDQFGFNFDDQVFGGQNGTSDISCNDKKVQKNEAFLDNNEKHEAESYDFGGNTPDKASNRVKKSFQGVENIIKETPEQPQFKDYCQLLELSSQKADDKRQFKEACIARSGVFCHIQDLNLILKSGTISMDHDNAILTLEVVLMTQDPVVVSSIRILNYGRHVLSDNNIDDVDKDVSVKYLKAFDFSIKVDRLELFEPPLIEVVVKNDARAETKYTCPIAVTSLNFYSFSDSEDCSQESFAQINEDAGMNSILPSKEAASVLGSI